MEDPCREPYPISYLECRCFCLASIGLLGKLTYCSVHVSVFLFSDPLCLLKPIVYLKVFSGCCIPWAERQLVTKHKGILGILSPDKHLCSVMVINICLEELVEYLEGTLSWQWPPTYQRSIFTIRQGVLQDTIMLEHLLEQSCWGQDSRGERSERDRSAPFRKPIHHNQYGSVPLRH